MAEIVVEPIEKYALSNKKREKTLFSKIGVVGCGKEGHSIARIASWHGMEVVFIELSLEKIESAIQGISKELDQRIENWGLTVSEKRAIMSRIRGSLDYKDLAGCDFVIEAIRSDEKTGRRSIDQRKEVFKAIEAVVDRDAIIATNATTIVISELASELVYRDRCVSLHFFVTSSEAKIIEVVKGLYTTDDVYNKVCTFVKLINRDVIPVEESAGLISVRLYVTLLNEACQALMEGVAKMEDIDKTMVIGLGMRFGPFHMADIIGLNKVIKWMDNLFEEFGDSKYKAAPIIKRMVRAKRLGVQTGEGFYRYDSEGRRLS
ncbi:3-hydroxyacyl-CoA dehydrogenase family protein [Xiashengella succiniciproducens]|jgi:3-hydroxybutyryl-CoA dehydrogenase|uniref:3-hydroxyacyl-CoA dehydrogenase NAD-binding domain-containing protein n=1 Tax=Xiashengella succiniciproducens TaxID=2949635 RepID=A0A9J6ZSQ8_9BACT|nr:3-hydroxyacyl-CoA dehydrogenase NAD-binding domain-containing protein [Alkaliflexus sp. Ai-910]MDI9537957.1 3-hydroxyacyl-CoA dehydrogenase NAD-binding domain-containing protein [Bacteroidota bacterium]URW80693.1 3-hydroxyacyl-CoA dehydrogenase NAD-binding domain-containing protein [Alkaliflexus sp. Ai-910]